MIMMIIAHQFLCNPHPLAPSMARKCNETQPNGTVTSSTLATTSLSTTGWDNWYGSVAQASAVLALARSQPVLLEAASCNNVGNCFLQVSPSCESRPAAR